MNNIKKYISSKIGSRVVVICFYSRNKKEKFTGVIEKAYSHIFSVRQDNGMIKSFNYCDVLTGNVRVYI